MQPWTPPPPSLGRHLRPQQQVTVTFTFVPGNWRAVLAGCRVPREVQPWALFTSNLSRSTAIRTEGSSPKKHTTPRGPRHPRVPYYPGPASRPAGTTASAARRPAPRAGQFSPPPRPQCPPRRPARARPPPALLPARAPARPPSRAEPLGPTSRRPRPQPPGRTRRPGARTAGARRAQSGARSPADR